VLALIEERLGELEREKTELTEYEELDRQRRALDYSLYEKQHAKVCLHVCMSAFASDFLLSHVH
jgi:hypothetical protein